MSYDVGDYVWCTLRFMEQSNENIPPTLRGYVVSQCRVVSVGEVQVCVMGGETSPGMKFLNKCDVMEHRDEATSRASGLAHRIKGVVINAERGIQDA